MLGKLVQTLTTVGVLLVQTSIQMCTVLKETRPWLKRQQDTPLCKPAYLSKPAIYQAHDSSLPQPLISERKFVIPVPDFLSTCFSKTIFPSGNVSLQPLFGWRCKYLGTHRFDIYIHICWNIYHLLFKVKSIDYRKQVLYHFLSNVKLKTAESLQAYKSVCSIITPLRLEQQWRAKSLQRPIIPARAPATSVLLRTFNQRSLKQRPQTNENSSAVLLTSSHLPLIKAHLAPEAGRPRVSTDHHMLPSETNAGNTVAMHCTGFSQPVPKGC